jgi:hypothetical protein
LGLCQKRARPHDIFVVEQDSCVCFRKKYCRNAKIINRTVLASYPNRLIKRSAVFGIVTKIKKIKKGLAFVIALIFVFIIPNIGHRMTTEG